MATRRVRIPSPAQSRCWAVDVTGERWRWPDGRLVLFESKEAAEIALIHASREGGLGECAVVGVGPRLSPQESVRFLAMEVVADLVADEEEPA